MKKKTAITLGALVLLAGGITFGGFKIKEKKEKDKIEETLNNVLVPNAERELDTLVLQEKDIQDSIRFLEEQIRQIDADSLISRSDVEVIEKLLNDIKNDLEKEESRWYNVYGKKYDQSGDGAIIYDFKNMPKVGRQQRKYFTYDIVAKILKNKNLTIPGYVMLMRKGYQPVSLEMPDSVYYEGETFDQINSFYRGLASYDLIELLIASLECVKPVQERYLDLLNEVPEEANIILAREPGKILTGPEQEELIKTLKYFVDHIDNSQGIIKPATLQKLKVVVDSLVVKSQEKQLSVKKSAKDKKIDSFQKARLSVGRKISKQQDVLKTYKSPDMVNQLYKQKMSARRK